jgi:hypothetical protein
MAKYDSYSLLSGKDRTFRKPSSVITATHVKGVDFRPEDLTFFNYLLSCSGNIKNPTGVYYVSMKDAMEFMRFERPGKIHECLERLCSGKIEVDYLDGDGNPRSLRSHYLSSDSSKAETGMIQYAFDQILVHFLIDPKVYGLISANRSNDIKSFSGKRLYEMMALQRHKWDTKWIVSLEEFRALTDTEGTHSRWDNYRRNVIEKAVGEVNAVADFEVLFSFMTSGQGGSVTTLEFDVVEKNHARLLQSKMVRSTKKKGSRLPDRDTVDMLDGKTTAERGGPAELTAAAVEEAASLIGDGNNLDNLVLEWREKTRSFSLNDPDGHFLNFVSLKVKKENDPVLNILDDEIFFNLLNGEDD